MKRGPTLNCRGSKILVSSNEDVPRISPDLLFPNFDPPRNATRHRQYSSNIQLEALFRPLSSKEIRECRRRRRQQQRLQAHSSSSDNSSLVVLYRERREDGRGEADSRTRPGTRRCESQARSASIEAQRITSVPQQLRQQASEHNDTVLVSCATTEPLSRRSLLSRSVGFVDSYQRGEQQHQQARRKFCPPRSSASDRRTRQHQLTGLDDLEEQQQSCRRNSDSGLMAQRSAKPQAKSLHRSDNFEPNLGLLMQHFHGKFSKGTGDNPASVNANDSQRIFPFQATPSGNLKIIPNQVVFESKKVSVLVADPRHAKVNVKAEQSQQQQQQQHAISSVTPATARTQRVDLPPGITTSTVDRLQAQRKLPPECRLRTPRTQPFNRARVAQQQDMQQQQGLMMEDRQTGQGVTSRIPAANDVHLSTLGFTSEQPIDWKNIVLPEKTDLYQELSRRITSYKNADCIVRIENDEFHCHLLVLQSYSTFFDDKNVKEIDLTGSSVTSRAFSIIYDWMISPTSESCRLLSRDNILDVFLAAQYLGIKELEEQCWAFIDNDELFSEDTAFLLYLEARKIGNTAVMELMVPRIMKFFLMLVSTKDFLELSVEELCLLLRSNYICVNSEMEVLMSAVRWLMHDWEGRKQYLLEIMKCVRFGLIAPWQLVDVKRNPENPEFIELMSYPEIQKMVDDGLAFVIIKYWYGNQTEDYYHWIDLLGLTEPTNRNWAGEDKNYVTYREFLLYLEEYQRTKLLEFKNKKQQKPTPPNSPPKEDSSTLPSSQPRARHPNQKIEMTSTTTNSRPSKQSTDTSGNNVPHALPPCMMMPPEVLSQYLNNIGAKPATEDVGKCNKSGMNANCTKRFTGGGEFPIKLVKSGRRQDAEKNNVLNSKKLKKEEDKPLHKKQSEKVLQPGPKFLYSIHSLASSTLDSETKKFLSLKYSDERNDSSKSEEEAATTIQAIYRGYKARRKLKEIRKRPSEDKRNEKRITDLLTIPDGLNLHKPLEPVKVSSRSDTQERNEKEDKENVPTPRNASGKSVVATGEEDNHVKKEISQLDDREPSEISQSNTLIETIMSPAYSISNEGKMSTIPSSDATDSEYLQFNEDRLNVFQSREKQCIKKDNNQKFCYSTSELQSRKNCKKNELKKISKCKPLAPQSWSQRVIGPAESSRGSGDEERPVVLVFGGIDPHLDYGRRGRGAGRDVHGYRAAENSWQLVAEMPEPRHHHSVAYLAGRVYLVGGADPREDETQRRSIALGTVWSYEPGLKNWYSEPAMLTPRQNFGLVVSDGKIFAIGGQNKNGIALKTVEAYDPVAREWKEMRSMHIGRIGPASVKYEGHIWVAGGMTKSKKEPITRDVECYDPSRNIWFRIDPLLSPRCFACLHVVSSRLFVIGGASRSQSADGWEAGSVESIGSVDIWEPRLCAWQPHAELAQPRHGHAVCSIGNQMLILGGVTTLQLRALKSVECYCCEQDKWIKGVRPLPFAVSGHDCISLPPSTYLSDNL